MAKKFILKDNEYETLLIVHRIYFATVVIILLLLMIVLRIFYLTVVQHDHFTTLSRTNRIKITAIPPVRGLIYSRNGILLAENKPSFSLEVTPEQISDIDKLIGELKKIILIRDSDVERFKESLSKKRRFENVALRLNLNEQEVAIFSVNRHRFDGVKIAAGLNRYYPLGEEIVHAVGYVAWIDEDDLKRLDKSRYSGTNHIGKLGIEKFYESLLHGEVGHQQVEVNAQGRVIRVLDRTPPKSGQNLHLTIEVELQKIAIQALDGRRGAIVAMDPNNGDILAFVSAPGYDPNKFVNGISHKSYNALQASKDKPLLNRAVQGEYPPGSTIKPFLGLVGLDEGMRTLSNKVRCPGWFSLEGHHHRYHDWKKEGHGHIDMHQAIVQSCDVYFYALAHKLGIDHIFKGLHQFGFGQLTGIDIHYEAKGLVPSREWKFEALQQAWFPGDTLILGIGQGYITSTPIQLARATAFLATRGKAARPRMLYGISRSTSGDKQLIPFKIENEIKLRDELNWDHIIASMRDVVHGDRGTARDSGISAHYKFAGKTGTAQVVKIIRDGESRAEDIPEEFRDHALFVGFAPLETPEIAVAIVVENGGSGSKTAAPIARRMFDHFMNNRNLFGKG